MNCPTAIFFINSLRSMVQDTSPFSCVMMAENKYEAFKFL